MSNRWIAGRLGRLVSGLLLVAVGCKDEPSPPATPPTAPPSPPAKPAIVGVDEQDDPNAPLYFPKSNEVLTWVKVKPVASAVPGELDTLKLTVVPPARLGGYNIQRATTATYRRTINGQEQTAWVELVQARSPTDALGILTVSKAWPPMAAAPGLLGVADTLSTAGLLEAKGNCWVAITGPEAGQGGWGEAARALMDRILFDVPQQPSPSGPWELLIGEADNVWIVRSAASLPLTLREQIGIDNAGRIDSVLGLNKDRLMVVAAYTKPTLRRPNFVWLVAYDTPADALAAHGRVAAHLETSTTPLGARSMVAKPMGRYLAGSWSAEEESILMTLTRLHRKLGS